MNGCLPMKSPVIHLVRQSITQPFVCTEQVSTILINTKKFCLSYMYENGTTRRDMREGTHTLKFAPSLDSHDSSAIISNKFIKIVTPRLRNHGSVMFSDVCLSVCSQGILCRDLGLAPLGSLPTFFSNLVNLYLTAQTTVV